MFSSGGCFVPSLLVSAEFDQAVLQGEPREESDRRCDRQTSPLKLTMLVKES